MDPEDLVVTLSPKYINNTYRDKWARVHGINNMEANSAPGICNMLKGPAEIHFLFQSFLIPNMHTPVNYHILFYLFIP